MVFFFCLDILESYTYYQKCINFRRKIVAFRINLKKKRNFVDKFQTNIIFLKDLTLIANEN
jgi:hypothetical protein